MEEVVPKNAPSIISKDQPPFTLSEIKASIPKHCFERSLFKSFSYLAFDVALVSILFFLATSFEYVPFGFILWPVYWIAQGSIFWGIWVLAHECGHGAFSENYFLNDIVGCIFHSLLLTPYFAWKYTHASHHSATNDLSRDTSYVPTPRRRLDSVDQFLQNVPFFDSFRLIVMLTLGWPAHLFLNVKSQKYPEWNSHFKYDSRMFKPNQQFYVNLSAVCVLLVSIIYSFIIYKFGFGLFFNFFFAPLLVNNFWLVMYTFLHHTDFKIPHYNDDEWNYVRGGLATIDRHYGVFDWFHHRIGSTHVCHHLFSKIPHYNAVEATTHLKKFLGKYYYSTTENPFISLWNEYRECKFIEETSQSGIKWWKSNMKLEKQE